MDRQRHQFEGLDQAAIGHGGRRILARLSDNLAEEDRLTDRLVVRDDRRQDARAKAPAHLALPAPAHLLAFGQGQQDAAHADFLRARPLHQFEKGRQGACGERFGA